MVELIYQVYQVYISGHLRPESHLLKPVSKVVRNVNLLISSLVSLGAENHFDVHLPILALADLVPGDDLDDGDENGSDGEDDDGNDDDNMVMKMTMVVMTMMDLCSLPLASPSDTCRGPLPSIWSI